MESIREILLRSEALLLFLVIGVGYLAGQIRVRGFRFGIAGVLFVGLLFGGWRPADQPSFAISNAITQIGLILFVYVVGLSVGPGFFSILKKSGIRFNIAALAALSLGAVVCLVLGVLSHIPIAQIAGVYSGGLSNTPALAAVTELIKTTGLGDPNDPAVGYSIAYPFGIIGGLLAFEIFARIFKTTLQREIADNGKQLNGQASVVTAYFRIGNPDLFDRAIGELRIQNKTGLILSRVRHENRVTVPSKYTVLHENDIVVAVGSKTDINRASCYFGSKVHQRTRFLGRAITVRRVLVSRKELVGRKIAQLQLESRFNAKVTRLRRADVEMIPRPDTHIEIGDHLRVVVPVENAAKIAEYFGDSERNMSEIDYTALTLGISLGVLIGMIPLPLPGGATVSLGFAGGPLVVGLVLGRFGRTGPLTWSIPHESSQALRHIGLLFFLAGVGIMAGGKFFDALSGNGLVILALGAATTTVTTVATLFLLRFFGKSSIISAIGATSGMQTQPATLAHAHEMTQSDEIYIAYASTYPVAMVGKILIAQLIVIIGSQLVG